MPSRPRHRDVSSRQRAQRQEKGRSPRSSDPLGEPMADRDEPLEGTREGPAQPTDTDHPGKPAASQGHAPKSK